MTHADESGQDLIDRYLDDVDAALRGANVPRARRRAIGDDIETQIGEMLAGTPQPPSCAAAAAVLARLDPPATFARAAAGGDAPPPVPPPMPTPSASRPTAPAPPFVVAYEPPLSFSRDARFGIVCLTAGLLLLGITGVGVFVLRLYLAPFVHRPPTGGALRVAVWVPIVAFALLGAALVFLLLATAYGWTALVRIGRPGGRQCGAAWAGVAALLVPVTLSWVVSFLFSTVIAQMYYGTHSNIDPAVAMSIFLGTVFGLVATGGWIFLAVRVASGRSRIAWPRRPIATAAI